MFFIDYGNTCVVTIDELKEISSDLIENHPSSYALNCELKLEAFHYKLDFKDLNLFFLNSIEGCFELRCLQRQPHNKYNDSALYQVELFESESKMFLIDFYASSKKITLNETEMKLAEQTCISESDTTSVTSIADTTNKDVTLDDKAIADNFLVHGSDNASYFNANATNLDNDTTFSYSQMPSKSLNDPSESVCEPTLNLVKSPKNDLKMFHPKTTNLSSSLVTTKNTIMRHLNQNESLNASTKLDTTNISSKSLQSDWTATPPKLKGHIVLPIEKISELSVSSFERLQNLDAQNESLKSDWTATPPKLKGHTVLPIEKISELSISSFERLQNLDAQNISKSESWTTTPPEKKNYNNLENTLSKTLNETNLANQTVDPSFKTTPLHMKNYNRIEFTLNETNGDQTEDSFKDMPNLTASISVREEDKDANENDSTLTDEDKINKSIYYDSRTEDNVEQSILLKDSETNDETYSTCEDESTLNQNEDKEEEKIVIFKNCLVSFIDPKTKRLYIQMEDIDYHLDIMQPKIEECFDPYDQTESIFCIAEFKADNKFYRCQMLNWLQENPEAYCYFIDFGNVDYVVKDTVTKMSEELCKENPYAFICKLSFDVQSNEFNQLTNLVTNEIKFDITLNIKELEAFYASKDFYNSTPVTVELVTSENKHPINSKTLNDENFLKAILASAMNELESRVDESEISIKQEPVSIIIEHTSRDNVDDDNDSANRKATKASCNDEKNLYLKRNEDNDDEGDEDESGEVFYSAKSNMALSSDQQKSADSFNEPNGGSGGGVVGSSHGVQSENSKMCAKLVHDIIDKAKVFDFASENKKLKISPPSQNINNTSHFKNESSDWSADESDSSICSKIEEKDLRGVKDDAETTHDLSTSHLNDEVSKYHDQFSDWSKNSSKLEESKQFENSKGIVKNSAEKENSLNEVSDASIYHDNSSCFEEENSKDTSQNVRIGPLNKDVSKHHDQSHDWDKSAANLNPNSSQLDKTNTTLMNHNKDASRYHDQSQDWDKSAANLNPNSTQLDKTNATLMNHNKDVSRYHDQSQDWDKSAANLSIDISNSNITLVHHNKSVSRYHDQSSMWTVNNTNNNDNTMNNTINNTGKNV